MMQRAKTVRRTMKGRRPAVVLLVVMLVLTSAAIVGITTLSMSAASAEQARSFSVRQASLDAARSGLAVVVAEIELQRDTLLRGGEPNLQTSADVGTLPDGSRLVYRLRPIGTNPVGRGEKHTQSESAKLNINVADAEQLARLPGISESVAAAIVERRNTGWYQSLADIIGVGGLSRSDVFGSGASSSLGAAPLADLVTVLGADPVVQGGVRSGNDSGADERARTGVRRINLNVPWGQSLADAVTARWGEFAAALLENIMNNEGVVLDSDSALIAELIRRRSGPEFWGAILDGFTANADLIDVGRVDVLRATEEVLIAAGLSESAAAKAIELRETLDENTRLSPAWLVTSECVSQQEFVGVVNTVASRSLVWRVIIEAGIEPGDDSGPTFASGEGFAPPPMEIDRPLLHAVVFEAVIDASYERARVSYLRDITHLQAALSISTIVRDEQADGRRFANTTRNDDPQFDEDQTDQPPARQLVWTRRTGEEMTAGDRSTSMFARSATASGAGSAMESDDTEAASGRPRQPRVGRWIVPGAAQ